MLSLSTAVTGLLFRAGVTPAASVRTPREVFQEIYWVFLVLGTIVGVIVIVYTLYNAYKYRDGDGDGTDADVDRPTLGEIPTGGGGGRKLFLSFGLSTIIVVSLIIWTYGTLLYVEDGPADVEDRMEVEVVGYQFGWEFVYPNGNTSDGTLRVPEDTAIELQVTSRDVFHNFGIPAFKIKADAIPGHHTDTWFVAEETGTYEAKCYELCGAGHSYMNATVEVMEKDEFESWYANTTASNDTATDATTTTTGH
jgi:cytochrome c oxidase subunit 2